LVRGDVPALDLPAERRLQELLVALANDQLLHSAHDCSDGGLAVTVAESCFDNDGMGAEISIAAVDVSRDSAMNTAAALFGESASRVLISVAAENATTVLARAAAAKVPARLVGQTGGNLLRIAVAGRIAVDVSIHEAERVWGSALERYFVKRVA